MNKTESRQPQVRPDIRNLRNDELEAVNGGTKTGSWLRAISNAMGQAANKQT